MKKGVDFIGVTCVFFCHDGQGRLLMHKRSKHCRDEQGRWDCGGGTMKHGEAFEDTVRREVREEYGTDPIAVKYVRTNNVLREHQGVKTHWIANIHLVEVDPETVKVNEPEKMDDIGWFSLDDLPEPRHSMLDRHLQDVLHLLKRT